jgi:methanogenic corrinoid protein MtbC1
MYEIIGIERDEADKYRVRVAIGGETVTFKFQDKVSDDAVQEEAARYDAMMQEQANGAPDTE